jgi:hypothetical protein
MMHSFTFFQIHNFGGKVAGQPGKHPAKPAHSSYNVNPADLALVTADDDSGSVYMDGGYKGMPHFSFPGLHDDRPDFTPPGSGKSPQAGKPHFNPGKGTKDEIMEESDFLDYSDSEEAAFGDVRFRLPLDGSFPDQPSDSMLRDLPGMGLHPNYPSTEDTLIDLKDLYLKNPFGNDFIRLEVDTERFRHNKTASGGIHHIPLIINGYPDIVKKTQRRSGEAKDGVSKRSGETKPKVSSRNDTPKPPGRSAQAKPKSRLDGPKPKAEIKTKNAPRISGDPAAKNRRPNKVAPPPAAVKKVQQRSSASKPTAAATTTASTTTTRAPFASQVRERLPGFMQNLSNSWAWDLGAAAA